MWKVKSAVAATFLALLPALSHAQQTQVVTVFSGTGFVVSTSGHIVTNQHVVEGCKQVSIRGGIPDTTAQVIATDEEFDLALLKTNTRIRRTATIRQPDVSRLELNEPVMLMGYPMDAFKTGQYQIAEATVIGLRGPTDEPQWIQFSDAAQHGNSGGPLLDSAGNVAGVVVGKTELYKTVDGEQQELISKSDIAISLPVLMKFLDSNFVFYRINSGQGFMMKERIEEDAKAYIVNVLCERPDIKPR